MSLHNPLLYATIRASPSENRVKRQERRYALFSCQVQYESSPQFVGMLRSSLRMERVMSIAIRISFVLDLGERHAPRGARLMIALTRR